MIPALKEYFGNRDVWDIDFRDDVIIDRKLTSKMALRQGTDVRVALGLYWTKEEYEKWREEALKIKLP